jgi:hypothetical protein
MLNFVNWFFGWFDLVVIKKIALVDFNLFRYKSYDEYKNTQIFHNQRKLGNIWADEKTLNRVSELVEGKNSRAKLGICHGVRNGFENKYFMKKMPGLHCIGTDISETAERFDECVQWDFHDTKPEWINHFDFVYSNSLDQSWNPSLALEVWLNQINLKGSVILEHTIHHGPIGNSKMDPFGVRPTVLPYLISAWFGHRVSIAWTKAYKSNFQCEAWLFELKKNKEHVVILDSQIEF